jgi:class 3 adenylate cyclase
MAEQLDPEEVREVQDAFISAVTPSIQEFGGSVEKYIGDAVLAVFGVPQAHEVDPERAVRAALGMQASLIESQIAEQLPLPPMRVGVHTGLVVSRVTKGGADFVVSGDTVNLAARLQSAAPAGAVFISEQTRRFEISPFSPSCR